MIHAWGEPILKKHLPAAGLAMFPKSGHVLNLEEPALFKEKRGAVRGRWWKRGDGLCVIRGRWRDIQRDSVARTLRHCEELFSCRRA